MTYGPKFYQFSILFLAIEWTVFGSMHFSLLPQTIQQIPDLIPPEAKRPVAIVTGMLSVTTGILVLVSSVRKHASMVSLFLLVLYLPAVYKLLACDDALPPIGAWAAQAFRIALLPNNILLGICSIYLLTHTLEQVRQSEEAASSPKNDSRDSADQFGVLVVALIFLMANCAGFLAILLGTRQSTSTACLWAMMCISLGALLGFMFAVPRVNSAVKSTSSLLPNTNIEVVSDWITKIVVGIGLVNFEKISLFVGERSQELSVSLDVDKTFAASLIVYFTVVGLIQGYILTRIYLSWQFASSLPAIASTLASEAKRPPALRRSV